MKVVTKVVILTLGFFFQAMTAIGIYIFNSSVDIHFDPSFVIVPLSASSSDDFTIRFGSQDIAAKSLKKSATHHLVVLDKPVLDLIIPLPRNISLRERALIRNTMIAWSLGDQVYLNSLRSAVSTLGSASGQRVRLSSNPDHPDQNGLYLLTPNFVFGQGHLADAVLSFNGTDVDLGDAIYSNQLAGNLYFSVKPLFQTSPYSRVGSFHWIAAQLKNSIVNVMIAESLGIQLQWPQQLQTLQQSQTSQKPSSPFTYQPPFATIPQGHPGLNSVVTTSTNHHGVAVFPHTRVPAKNNEAYALFMQRSDNNLWRLPGGQLGKKVHGVMQPENYGEAGARELYEESIRAYGSDPLNNLRGDKAYITSDDLLRSPYSVVRGLGGDVHTLFFARVPFVPPSDFLRRANQETEDVYKKHIDFAWVRVKDLKEALDQMLATPGWRNGGYLQPSGHIHLNKLGGGSKVTLWPRTVRALVEDDAMQAMTALAGASQGPQQQSQKPQQPSSPFTYHPPFATIPQGHPGLNSVITTKTSNHGVAALAHTRIPEKNNNVYFLFMQRSDNNLWGTPGGKLGEKVHGVMQPENYGEAGARELYEESVRAYGSHHFSNLKGDKAYITSNDLLRSPYSVVRGSGGDVHILFFARVPFVSPSDFLRRTNQETDHAYTEHIDFAWVRAKDLKKALESKLATPGWRAGGYLQTPGHIHLNRLGGGSKIALWPRAVRALVEPDALKIIIELAQ